MRLQVRLCIRLENYSNVCRSSQSSSNDLYYGDFNTNQKDNIKQFSWQLPVSCFGASFSSMLVSSIMAVRQWRHGANLETQAKHHICELV